MPHCSRSLKRRLRRSRPRPTDRSVHEIAPGPAPPSFVRLDRLVQIIDSNGSVLARSANLGAAKLPVSPESLSRLSSGAITFETLTGLRRGTHAPRDGARTCRRQALRCTSRRFVGRRQPRRLIGRNPVLNARRRVACDRRQRWRAPHGPSIRCRRRRRAKSASHRRRQSRRTLAASRHTRRDRQIDRYVERHARSPGAKLRSTAALHRGCVARTSVTAVPAACRTGSDAAATPQNARVCRSAEFLPRRGGSDDATRRRAGAARAIGCESGTRARRGGAS